MTPSRPNQPTTASPSVVAGLGCRRGCPQDELLALLIYSLEQQGLTVDNLVALTSIAHKRDEPGLHALAQQLRLELTFFTPEELIPYQATASGSAITLAATGSPAVAEPGALALAACLGTLPRQLGEKTRSASATCALATFDRDCPA